MKQGTQVRRGILVQPGCCRNTAAAEQLSSYACNQRTPDGCAGPIFPYPCSLGRPVRSTFLSHWRAPSWLLLLLLVRLLHLPAAVVEAAATAALGPSLARSAA